MYVPVVVAAAAVVVVNAIGFAGVFVCKTSLPPNDLPTPFLERIITTREHWSHATPWLRLGPRVQADSAARS